MNVVTRKHLVEAAARFPDAAKEIQAWYKIATAARWQTFSDLRQTFRDADLVDEFVIFNIRHNRYRLITIVHYSHPKFGRITEGHIYIRSVLTHRQYENRANWNKGVNS